jgi:hypothetical protein
LRLGILSGSRSINITLLPDGCSHTVSLRKKETKIFIFFCLRILQRGIQLTTVQCNISSTGIGQNCLKVVQCLLNDITVENLYYIILDTVPINFDAPERLLSYGA